MLHWRPEFLTLHTTLFSLMVWLPMNETKFTRIAPYTTDLGTLWICPSGRGSWLWAWLGQHHEEAALSGLSRAGSLGVTEKQDLSLTRLQRSGSLRVPVLAGKALLHDVPHPLEDCIRPMDPPAHH